MSKKDNPIGIGDQRFFLLRLCVENFYFEVTGGCNYSKKKKMGGK